MPAMLAADMPPRYSAAMRAIHWATAILMIVVVVLAWIWPNGPARNGSTELFLHRSFGLAVLALTVLRLAIRRTQPTPPESTMLTRFEALASHATHLLLYVILVAMPVSGFLWATSRGAGVDVFGLFEIPPLLPPSDTLHSAARFIHAAGQNAVYVVVGLHVLAALFHWLVKRDDVMGRMLPGAERLIRQPPPAGARPAAR